MKLIISALSVLFSLNVIAAGNCNLGYWDTQIDKLNESYARGDIDHHTYFTQARGFQRMIGKNTYECIFQGKTSDLNKDAIKLGKTELAADKIYQLETAQNRLKYELKYGSATGAVEAKMELEKLEEKFSKIEVAIESL